MHITHIRPPIPLRDFDWAATQDDYEPGCPIGYGRTREEAVADLEEQLAELAFYADPANHVGHRDPSASVYIETSAVEADGGKRARAALNRETGQ